LKDAESHHCFFRAAGLHNHLSHHLLAVYDLGASAGLLQKIYKDEATSQRPIILEPKDESIVVNKDNWIQYLENQSAYGAFVNFFAEQVKVLGVPGVLEKYIFDPEVNKNGIDMLSRVVAGALHPMIHIGYGAEFGDQALIATGLSEAAMTRPLPKNLFHSEKAEEKETSQSITLLELLAQVYESKILHPPMPYDPDALLSARTRLALANGGAEEIHRICSQYGVFGDFKETDLASKVEECIWVTTLLLASTGKEGRKPRLDFFLMHLVTSSLFLQPLFKVLEKPAHKAALLNAYIPVLVLITLTRGRPRINPELLMSYTDIPRPPVSAGDSQQQPNSVSLGNPQNDTDYNPWPAIIEAVQYDHDSHVPKTLRTLIFASQKYGDKAPGTAIGAFHQGDSSKAAETHKGTGKMDGTIFVRAAGMVMDTLGWVSYGQKKGSWDRSALGWEAAWDSGD